MSMGCTNEEMARLLPFYAAGTLTAEERTNVDEHLRACAACQAALNVFVEGAKIFSDCGLEQINQHIDSEQLIEYCHDRAATARAVANRIEQHLRVCRLCAEDVALIEDMNRALASAPEKPRIGEHGFPPLERWLHWPPAALKPWVSVAAALVVVIAAVMGYFLYPPRTPTQNRAAPHFTLATEDRIRSGPVDDPDRINLITLTRQQSHFFIDFAFEIKNDPTVRYDLEITDRAGKTVAKRQGVRSVNEYGFFEEKFERDRFEAGSYWLTVQEVTVPGGRVTRDRRYPFRVITQP